MNEWRDQWMDGWPSHGLCCKETQQRRRYLRPAIPSQRQPEQETLWRIDLDEVSR